MSSFTHHYSGFFFLLSLFLGGGMNIHYVSTLRNVGVTSGQKLSACSDPFVESLGLVLHIKEWRGNMCSFQFLPKALSLIPKTGLGSLRSSLFAFPLLLLSKTFHPYEHRELPFTQRVCSVVALRLSSRNGWYYVTGFYVSVHGLQLCKAFLSPDLCSASFSLNH